MNPVSPRFGDWIRNLVPLALIFLAVAAVDTSCTPKPHCAAGQTAQRMPSHQHWMWTCAPERPAS